MSAVAVVLLAVVAATAATDEATPTALVGGQPPVVQPHRESRFDPVPPQRVEASTTILARADRHRKVRVGGPRGGRVFTVSQLASHDLPQAALTAYRTAAGTLARTDPSCHLPWTLLAAIGRVESDHGRYGGSVLATDGVSRPGIIGVRLDGRGPVAAIHDTDDGRLDGDRTWDRAVGPMQFIPGTWSWAGRDGDADGRRDPHDLDDAAVAAGDYLCAGSDLRDDDAMDAAILRYNPSDSYVRLVRAFEVGYRTGVFVLPSPDAPADEDRDRPRRKRPGRDDRADRNDRGDRADRGDRGGRGDRDGSRPDPTPKPKPKPKPKPTPKDPKPSPAAPGTPTPAPTPSGQPTQPAPAPSQPAPSPSQPAPSPSPALENVTGPLTACGGGWCLDGTPLDLGSTGTGQGATHDYDQDGSTETVGDELAGLAAGGPVTMRVERSNGSLLVHEIAGLPFPH